MKNWKYIEGAKTGNKNQDWDVGNIDWDVGNFNGQWYVTKNGKKLVGPFMSMKEAERYLDGHKWELQNKYGNSKTGNDTAMEYATRKPKVINEEKTGAEEFFKKLSDDVKEREKKDDADIEKVGNALGKDIYQHKLDPNQYMVVDWDKDTVTIIVNGVVRDVIKNTDKVAYAVDHVYKRVNSMNKVGNALNWDENLVGKFVWVKDKGQEWKVYVMQDKGDKVYIRDDDGSQGWVSKTRITGKVGNSKTGNVQYHKVGNSASDDKFAYVMREFDEGKLKTPDGKVVTDPAQAKAIAYSESKKTENGLARARRAMAGNGLLDTVLSKTKHIKRFGIGSKVQAEGETGTVVKETVEVGPNGIPFGWVTVKFSDGKTRQYYDYDLKK